MTNAWAVPYKRYNADNDMTMVARDVISFAAGQASVFYGNTFADPGSARFIQQWETLYLDNSGNDYAVTVVCLGSLISMKFPARSQGFIPLTCPMGSFGFTAYCANPAAIDIPIALFDADVGPGIWNTPADPTTLPAAAMGQTAVDQTAVTIISDNTMRSRRAFYIKNIGTTNIYIAPRFDVSTTNGYLLKPGEEFKLEVPGAQYSTSTQGFRAISDAAGGRVCFAQY